MTETQRIEARSVETHMLSSLDPQAAPRAAFERARAELLEKAVLANADGWQSGEVEYAFSERPSDLAIEALVWMVMTRD